MLGRIAQFVAPSPNFDEELREACFEGDVVRSKRALDLGANPESRGETGNTPFLVAAYHGRDKVIEMMLKRGKVNILHTGRSGNSALHYASRRGHIEVVKTLLSFSKELVNMRNDAGFSAIHLATLSLRKDVIRELITFSNSDVNAKDKQGFTALHFCALRNNIEIARLLLKFGADHLIENQEKKMPSDICTSEAMKVLFQDASHRRCEWFHLVDDEQDVSSTDIEEEEIINQQPKFPFKSFLTSSSSKEKGERKEKTEEDVKKEISVELKTANDQNDDDDDDMKISLTAHEDEYVPKDYASMLLDHDDENNDKDMMSFFTRVEQSVLEKMKSIVNESNHSEEDNSAKKNDEKQQENKEFLYFGGNAVVISDKSHVERACLDVTIKSSDLAMPWGITEMGKRRKRAVGMIVRILEIDWENEIAKIELSNSSSNVSSSNKENVLTWIPIAALVAPTKENIEKHHKKSIAHKIEKEEEEEDEEEEEEEEEEDGDDDATMMEKWTRDQETAVVCSNPKFFEKACLNVTLSSTSLAMPWGVTEMGIRRQESLGQTVKVVEIDDENHIAEVRLSNNVRVWVPLVVLMKK